MGITSNRLRGTMTMMRGKYNKYLMFKNQDRKSKMIKSNILFTVLGIISSIVFYLSLVAVAVMATLWFLLALLTLFSFQWNELGPMMIMGSLIALGSLVVLLFSNVFKFLIEYNYMRKEHKELQEMPEENQHYIDIAKIILQTIKMDLIAIAVFFLLPAAGFGIGIIFDFNTAMLIAILGLIVAIIWYFVNRFRKLFLYRKIAEPAARVVEERRELKKLMKAEDLK